MTQLQKSKIFLNIHFIQNIWASLDNTSYRFIVRYVSIDSAPSSTEWFCYYCKIMNLTRKLCAFHSTLFNAHSKKYKIGTSTYSGDCTYKDVKKDWNQRGSYRGKNARNRFAATVYCINYTNPYYHHAFDRRVLYMYGSNCLRI